MVQVQEDPEFKVILNLRKFEENLGYMRSSLGHPTILQKPTTESPDAERTGHR